MKVPLAQAWSFTSTSAVTNGDTSISVTSAGSVKTGDKLVISGGGNSETLVVKSVDGGTITFESGLSNDYGKGWYIYYYYAVLASSLRCRLVSTVMIDWPWRPPCRSLLIKLQEVGSPQSDLRSKRHLFFSHDDLAINQFMNSSED